MGRAALSKIVAYADRLLRLEQWADWPGAANGLQVENDGRVHRIAAAVDASWTTIRMAVAADTDLLVVHHGLFWSPSHPWTDRRYSLIKILIENNLAVYSCHLPLDAHRRLGNNALLCRTLGLKTKGSFFVEKGQAIGLLAEAALARDNLVRRLRRAVGQEPLLMPFGPAICRRIGIVTGGAGDQLRLAAAEGIDTFITGEGPHWSHALAEELAINVLYGGHYATETFGVKALARHLAAKYRLPWTFLDNPTGL